MKTRYLAVPAIILLLISIMVYEKDGKILSNSEEMSAILSFLDDKAPPDCLFIHNPVWEAYNLENCSFFLDAEGNAEVAFLGDSHNWMFAEAAQELLSERGVSSFSLSVPGCFPIPNFELSNGGTNCKEFVQEFDRLFLDMGVSTVVITARFPLYFSGVGFNNHEGGQEKVSPLLYEHSDTGDRIFLGEFEGVVAELEKLSSLAEIVFVEPIPEVGFNVPNRLAGCIRTNLRTCSTNTPLDAYVERMERTRAFFATTLFEVIPVKDLFCSSLSQRCETVEGGVPLYQDDDHLSFSVGGKLLARRVTDFLISR